MALTVRVSWEEDSKCVKIALLKTPPWSSKSEGILCPTLIKRPPEAARLALENARLQLEIERLKLRLKVTTGDETEFILKVIA